MSPLLVLLVLLTQTPEPRGAVVVLTRRTGANAQVTTTIVRELRKSLAEAGVDAPLTPDELTERLLSLGVKDSTTCEGKKACALELGRQLKVPNLISVTLGQIASDVSIHVEALQTSDGAKLADDTVLLDAAELAQAGARLAPFARRLREALAPVRTEVAPAATVPAAPVAPSAVAVPPAAIEVRPDPDLSGTHFDLTLRGQLSPTSPLTGAWVIHAAWIINEAFAIGAGLIIAKPVGAMVRGSWVPFNVAGRVRPRIALEVPVFFASGSAVVGVGGSLGVEVRLLRNFALGAEVPFSFYPSAQAAFHYFGALSLSGRL